MCPQWTSRDLRDLHTVIAKGHDTCRPYITNRTLIGGSAHQTQDGSDLLESHLLASDLTDSLPPAFHFKTAKTEEKEVLCRSA